MGVMKDLWIKWKMLKLPWRKTFLIGMLKHNCKAKDSAPVDNVLTTPIPRPGSLRQYLLGISRQAERRQTSTHRAVQS